MSTLDQINAKRVELERLEAELKLTENYEKQLKKYNSEVEYQKKQIQENNELFNKVQNYLILNDLTKNFEFREETVKVHDLIYNLYYKDLYEGKYDDVDLKEEDYNKEEVIRYFIKYKGRGISISDFYFEKDKLKIEGNSLDWNLQYRKMNIESAIKASDKIYLEKAKKEEEKKIQKKQAEELLEEYKSKYPTAEVKLETDCECMDYKRSKWIDFPVILINFPNGNYCKLKIHNNKLVSIWEFHRQEKKYDTIEDKINSLM